MGVGPTSRGPSRSEILRGVYEDNLRVVSRPIPEETPPRPRMWPLFAAVAVPVLAILLIDVVYPVFSRTRQDDALQGLYREAPLIPIDDSIGTASPADASSYGAFAADPSMPLATLFDLQIKKIVIDPGHGGKDPGAVGRLAIREKDITLDVARRLKARLEGRRGYEVILTRETDTYLSLRERVAFANERKADLFISIHVNYLPEEPLSVIETYYFGAQSDEATLKLAEKENRDSDYSFADFDEMIAEIGNTMKLQESKRTAVSIQKSLYRNMRRINGNVRDLGVKTAPFVVLLGVEAPSVLAEIACLSNREEEAKLNTEAYRDHLATYLEEGIVNYLKQRPNHNESVGEAPYYATEEKGIR